MENNELLYKLLKLSEEKEIPFTKKQLEKFSPEKLELIYKEKELEEFNEAVTDVVISKMDEYMKKYHWIKEDSQLGKKLQNKKLFRNDLKSFVSWFSPMLPFIGIIEGGVTIAGEVFDKSMENKKENESSSSKTETGGEQNPTRTESPESDQEFEN